MRYMQRIGDSYMLVETVEGQIRRYRGKDFHPYYTSRDPALIFIHATSHSSFQEMLPEEPTDEEIGGRDEEEKHGVEMMEERKRKFAQPILEKITPKTPPLTSRAQGLR